ncbi:MAG: hypothetical protein ISEC1_P1138 [Thiomicrorhabdus sp.]|nr:MAG: hypothetical protein ISEC1_P1138 [Thiomicrorhabdus sp.]
MFFFKWLAKSLLAVTMIGMLSACDATTPAKDGADATATKVAPKIAKTAKETTLETIDKDLEAVFNKSSGLF